MKEILPPFYKNRLSKLLSLKGKDLNLIEKIIKYNEDEIVTVVERSGNDQKYLYFIFELLSTSIERRDWKGIEWAGWFLKNAKKIKKISKKFDPLLLIYYTLSKEEKDIETPSTEILVNLILETKRPDSHYIEEFFLYDMKNYYKTVYSIKTNKYRKIKETKNFIYYELNTIKDCRAFGDERCRQSISFIDRAYYAKYYIEKSLTNTIVMAIDKKNPKKRYFIVIFKNKIDHEDYWIVDERNLFVDGEIETLLLFETKDYFIKKGRRKWIKHICNDSSVTEAKMQLESRLSDISNEIVKNIFLNLYNTVDSSIATLPFIHDNNNFLRSSENVSYFRGL